MGVVSDVLRMLDRIEGVGSVSSSELKALSLVSSISIEDALEVALGYGYLTDCGSCKKLSDDGRRILTGFKHGCLSQESLRQILSDYIVFQQPTWSFRIPSGRREASRYMTVDEKACFREAGLLEGPVTEEVLKWWDVFAQSFRSTKDNSLAEIGRRGEALSMEYERMRTNREPVWEALESNMSGYDILSSQSAEDSTSIYIEVKASEKPLTSASLFISKTEWAVLFSHRSISFLHLWLLAEGRLAVISSDVLDEHIPIQQGAGSWSSLEVPFSACCDEDMFHSVC